MAATLAGCATREKTYNAPSAAKVQASQKKLAEAVDKATATAVRAMTKVGDAQKSADELAATSVDLITDVDTLAKTVPAELRPDVQKLKEAVQAQQVKEGELSTNLDGAYKEQGQLTKDLADAKLAKLELQNAQTDYQNEAAKLAIWATDERTGRVEVEKKLSWYRWHWWGSWIALGAGVIACGLFAFLKFTGRLTFNTAALAAKVGI